MDNHHPAMTQLALGRAATSSDDALVSRDAVRCEIESELRGLLLSARMHGFTLAIVDGKGVVTDQRAHQPTLMRRA